MSDDTLTVFIDGVDWQHEIPYASGGNRIYYSLADLKLFNECWEQCGVVKVTFEVKDVNWVVPQDLSLPDHKDDGKTRAAKEIDRLRARNAVLERVLLETEAHVAWLDSFDQQSFVNPGLREALAAAGSEGKGKT